MSPARTANALRSELRRKTAWFVAIAFLLGLVDLAIIPLPSGRDWRAAGAIFSLILDAVAVTIIGSWFLRRPLLRAIATLERQARAAEAERSHAERLASAGRVAAGLAHEVGNPLCAIANYAHSLEEKVPPELRGTVGALRREVSRIERLVDGFLDHARPREPGALGADVNAALRETLGFLADQGILRRITLETQLDDGALPVPGNPLDLEQTFANLLLNAADAMPSGGRLTVWTRRLPRAALVDRSLRRASDAGAPGTATASGTGLPRRVRDERLERWVAASDVPEVVKIVIADSGSGVAAGNEERIFEPFFTTKEKDEGSGLGLAIVRRLVEAMGGLVWAQRSREGGAAFHLVLPVHVPTRS